VRCPSCGHLESSVLDSRPVQGQRAIRRRRECAACGHRFTTYERAAEPSLIVVKKRGLREAFDLQKMIRGLMRACERRPVTSSQIHELAAEVEQELRGRGRDEVPSRLIGNLVMNKLRALDEVAYVRFASVYRQFTEVEEFGREVERLRQTRDRQAQGSHQPTLFGLGEDEDNR